MTTDYFRQKFVAKLSSNLDPTTIKFITQQGDKIANHLVDWLVLVESIKTSRFVGQAQYDDVTGEQLGTPEALGRELYYDYAFVVAPAYKAYEGYLFLLAEKLGLKDPDDVVHSVGHLYDEDHLLKLKEEIVTEIGKKLNTADTELIGQLTELKRVLQLYRHNPAHFLGDRINTFEKAENYGRTVLTVINQTTKHFLREKYIAI